MAIKFLYPKIVLDKMQRLIDRVHEEIPTEYYENYKQKRRKNRLVQAARARELCGMDIGYLEGCIKGNNLEPSGRVLKNMGFKIFIKDLESGEMEELKFFGICDIDHSDPANPKLDIVED